MTQVVAFFCLGRVVYIASILPPSILDFPSDKAEILAKARATTARHDKRRPVWLRTQHRSGRGWMALCVEKRRAGERIVCVRPSHLELKRNGGNDRVHVT